MFITGSGQLVTRLRLELIVTALWQTFRDFRHTAGLNPEGGFPLLGCSSSTVLLVLGAAELTLCFWLLAAVSAHADDALKAQQEDATVTVAHHNDLHSKTCLALCCWQDISPRPRLSAQSG